MPVISHGKGAEPGKPESVVKSRRHLALLDAVHSVSAPDYTCPLNQRERREGMDVYIYILYRKYLGLTRVFIKDKLPRDYPENTTGSYPSFCASTWNDGLQGVQATH